VTRRGFLSLVLVLLGAVDLYGQVQLATVRGRVRQPDGAAAPAAQQAIVDALGQVVTTTVAARDGRFEFTGIAPGTYQLRAGGTGFSTVLRPLSVEGAIPLDIDIQLPPAVTEEVVVQGSAEPAAPITTRASLAGEIVDRMPSRLRGRGVQDAIATIPGWSTEDNGLLHVRGVDDGLLYVIDGVPVHERLDGLFGLAPDPGMIDSMHVLTGYIPPEFGLKSGGVVEVRSRARLADRWSGNVEAGAGSRRTRHVTGLVGGPLSSRATLTSGLSAERSAAYLDPVDPAFLHSDGDAESGGVQLMWNPAAGDNVSAIAGFGRSRYDVPNSAEQEQAGQDQQQRLRQYWQTASWQRAWSSSIVSQVAGYARQSTASLRGSELDTPLHTDANRSLRRAGVLASVTRDFPRHLVKAGGEVSWLRLEEDFTFAVAPGINPDETDLTDEALAFTSSHPFHFHGTARPSLWSFYVQDSVRASSRLSVDLGVRFDRTQLLVAATQASPRLGMSYRFPTLDTAVRASFSRFFQPPQAENLLLASSEEGRALSPFDTAEGAGGAEIRPERQDAVEIAVEQRFARMRVDVAYWHRRVRDAADPNVFFGSTIIFPNAVARGRASGFDLRIEVPRRRNVSGYISYTNARVVQFGPIVGDLFLEDDVPDLEHGEAFTPDHDQRNVAAAGVTYDHAPSGSWLSLSGRYESGTPLEVDADDIDELQERPGAERVDFGRMRVRPRRIVDLEGGTRLYRQDGRDFSIRFAVLNVFNHAFAYNFGNPFSGTHFGAGRTLSLSVRAGF
jgi:hypothetical protein